MTNSKFDKAISACDAFRTRSGAVEAMLDAANATITARIYRQNDFIPGSLTFDEREISSHEYADDTDISGICPVDGRATLTMDFIDGLGAMVTQKIIHKDGFTTTTEYLFDVETESDNYAGHLVRMAANAVKAHDAFRTAEIEADLDLFGVVVRESLAVSRTPTANPHITVTQDSFPSDAAARVMTATPEAECDGITGAIIQFEPSKLPYGLAHIPTAVCIREETFVAYERRYVTDYWQYRFDFTTTTPETDEPTGSHDYAAFCGAREY